MALEIKSCDLSANVVPMNSKFTLTVVVVCNDSGSYFFTSDGAVFKTSDGEYFQVEEGA
jgi:hypothetical protein